MKIITAAAVALGLLIINATFLLIVAVAGASMASVDGVAQPWQRQIYAAWAVHWLPYLIYLVSYVAVRPAARHGVLRGILFSAWLVLPAALSAFIFVESAAIVILPLLQILLFAVVWRRTPALEAGK